MDILECSIGYPDQPASEMIATAAQFLVNKILDLD